MNNNNVTAKKMCEDLFVFYVDASALAKALDVAEALCSLGMRRLVVRVGFIGRLRLQPDGLPAEVIRYLSDEENTLLRDLDEIGIIDKLHEKKQQNVERLRQMLLAIVNDVRVVVIKLALQVVAMRHLESYPSDKRQQLALQTRDIFAPLANRLGIAKLKWELEDLALRELEPTTYKLIATSLAEQRRQREKHIVEVVNTLQVSLQAEGIEQPAVYGRAKHINSIYAKMKKKHKRLEEIYDLLAIRVQVSSVRECYTVLGTVHAMWQHVPSEFDDYIANPKSNGYQSLHTAVVGPNNKTVEIQIRTNEMHDYAELGVAAHWRYKENSTGKVSAFEKQINWLRHLLEEGSEEIAEEFSSEIAEDRVYVITPQGQVVDLPHGATPLDFAYQIHTDIGHRTRGAMVNGVMVPITYQLKTSDSVEVLTGAKLQPSRDWLNASLGYLKSPRSRAKVKQFFKRLQKDKATIEGRDVLEKALNRVGLKPNAKQFTKVCDKYNLKSIEDFHAAIGFGDIGITPLLNYFEETREDKNTIFDDIQTRLARIPIRTKNKNKDSISIEGISDLLISIATCCSPVAPDDILGFITKTKGVSIHRANCSNVVELAKREADKIITVNWSGNHQSFSTTVNIKATDRVGLIRDIVQILSNEAAVIHHANFARDEDLMVNMQLQLSVADTQHLDRVLERLKSIKNINSAMRVVMTN